MDKATGILLVFCLILASGFGFLYYKYEYKTESVEYSNISISAEFEGNKIKTGYVIETSNGEILGNTSKSYEKETVKVGDTIKIYNKNLKNQNFYPEIISMAITKNNQRVKLDLKEPKEIIVKINKTNPIKVYLESEDARDIDFCISWSLNYIFVEALNFTETEKTGNWGRCYDGDFSLKNSNKTIEIKYTRFGNINEDDYIKLFIKGINNQTIKIL